MSTELASGSREIPNEGIITISVGGEKFTTMRATLTDADPESMLAQMFSGRHALPKDSSGAFFIDRDPKWFRAIIQFLRSGDIALPDTQQELEEIMIEADYYMLRGLKARIMGHIVSDLHLRESDLKLKQDEDRLRARYLKEDKDISPHEGLINVFEDVAKFVESDDPAPPLLIMDDIRRVVNNRPSTCGSIAQFKRQFEAFTGDVLKDFNWKGFVCAGGSVLGPLLPVPDSVQKTNTQQLQRYYRNRDEGYYRHPASVTANDTESASAKFGFEGSDIDLFIVGLSKEEAIDRIVALNNQLRRQYRGDVLVVRTPRSLTFATGWPRRNIQVILRLYQSPSEVLIGFDLDCVGFLFDGSNVLCLPRAMRALNCKFNVADPTRQTLRTNTYEYRLWKYSKRGFGVVVPGLRRSQVDTTLYLRDYVDLVGLARLLYLEARDHSRFIHKGEHKNQSDVKTNEWIKELAVFTKDDEATFLDFVENQIVTSLEDYNSKVLVPFYPSMSVRQMANNILGRLYRLGYEAEQRGEVARISFIAVFDSADDPFEQILDAGLFSLETEHASYQHELALPRHIEFIGSLKEYLASIESHVEEDWYKGALRV